MYYCTVDPSALPSIWDTYQTEIENALYYGNGDYYTDDYICSFLAENAPDIDKFLNRNKLSLIYKLVTYMRQQNPAIEREVRGQLTCNSNLYLQYKNASDDELVNICNSYDIRAKDMQELRLYFEAYCLYCDCDDTVEEILNSALHKLIWNNKNFSDPLAKEVWNYLKDTLKKFPLAFEEYENWAMGGD